MTNPPTIPNGTRPLDHVEAIEMRMREAGGFHAALGHIVADSATHWQLKSFVETALKMDPVDAIKDAEVLTALCRVRWAEMSKGG